MPSRIQLRYILRRRRGVRHEARTKSETFLGTFRMETCDGAPGIPILVPHET